MQSLNMGRGVLAAVMVAATIALAACGSDSSGTSTQNGASTAEGSTPYVIGTIGSYSGANASSSGEIPKVVSAWAKMVNAAGGINGHPVEVKVFDDAQDPTKALQGAKKLVEEDHVMAIVGESSNQDGAFQKYVERKGIPVVGGLPYSASMTGSADFFPSGGNLVTAGYGLAVEAKKAGKTKFSLAYCAEAPVCATFIKPFGKTLSDVIGGMSLVFSAKVAANEPSFTAQCLAAKDAGADAMFVETFSAVVSRVLTDCSKQGYKPGQYNVGGDVGNDVVANPAAEGMTVIQFNLPKESSAVPGGKVFNDALDTYAPGVKSSTAFTDNILQAWTGFQLFKAVAEQAKLTPSASYDDIKNGLYSLKDETLDGLAPKLNYVKGKPTLISCYFVERIEGGKVVPMYNGAPQCVPPEKIAPMYAAWK